MRIRVKTAIIIASLCVPAVGAVAASFGRIVGQENVSAMGSAQYSIPLWMPPGIGSIQPNLSLTYDSKLGYGFAGPGWTLSGLSAIARCNLTYAQDGTPAPVTLSAADGLCLDGNRLRSTGTGTYQTEIANFSNVVAIGTAGNGPSYFSVQAKNGLTYEYGNTTDSKILPSSTVTTPYIWALDKVTDRYGNYMTFTYTQTNGSYVPFSIQYAATTGSMSFPYSVTFGFSNKSTTDTKTAFVAGTEIQQTKQLSNITVLRSGVILRSYNLGYSTSTATLRATLTSVQECGGSAGSDCLPSTNVAYQNGTSGVATPATATGSGAVSGGGINTADIDGDGKMDLVFATLSGGLYHWSVQLAMASGYAAPVSTGAVTTSPLTILLDHFDGKTRSQLIAPNGSTWYSYQWNGSSFTATSTGIPYVSTNVYSSVDVNGDGLPDLVFVSSTAFNYTISVQLNTGNGTSVAFASTPVVTTLAGAPSCYPPTNPCPTYSAVTLYGNNQFSSSSIKHFDFDGDGRQDLILFFESTLNSKTTGTVMTLLSRGSGSTIYPFVTGNIVPGGVNPIAQIQVALWNDDACTDLVVNTTVYVSDCNGVYGGSVTLPAYPFLALDWDGDGRTDLIAESNSVFYVYKSQGGPYTTITMPNFSIGNGAAIVTDMNGDGLDDVAYWNPSGAVLQYGMHNGSGIKPDLATSFTDGYGLAFSPSYLPLTNPNVYNGGFADAQFPYENYIGSLYVVNQTIISDPTNLPSGTYQQTYTYSDAWVNLQGRGFVGFSTVSEVDSRIPTWMHYSVYSQTFPTIGASMMDTMFLIGSSNVYAYQHLNTPSYTALNSASNDQRYFPYISQSKNTEYQVGGASAGQTITTQVTNFTFDNYGNATNVSTTITDNDAISPSPYLNDTWNSTTATTIVPNTADWCLNLPTEVAVTNSSSAPGGAPITRTTQYNSPDYAHCVETEKVTEPASPTYKVTEDYAFDPTTGNLTSDTVTGIGMAARTTTISWNSTAQFPSAISNPLSQSTILGFDLNSGKINSLKDPNGVTTSWQYDNFARMKLESRPDGTSTTYAYNSCATAGCVNSNNLMTVTATTLNVGGATRSIRNMYHDALDRTLVTSGLMLSGAYDRMEVQYDNLGNLHLQGSPCTFISCVTYWTTNTYDLLHRLVQSERQISATNATLETTGIQYSGRTTTTIDALGHATTRIYLVSGSVARSQDANNYYQNFTYDAAGSLKSIIDNASPANTLFTANYAYGLAAYQTGSTDADLGSSIETYNALGELMTHTDAKGQNFSFNYDVLSRPTSRTEPDLTTTWLWGNTAASFNIGRLQSISSLDSVGTYSESYTYDNESRLSTFTAVIPGDTSYTFTTTYNSTTGLTDTLQYPVSTSSYQLKLQYSYANGLLKEVSDLAVGTAYWVANATNPRGQLTQETLGNGLVVNHSFDALTSLVSTIQAGVGGGTALQNNAYLFDALGNATQRQDNKLGLTENFFYDLVNRLDHSTLTNAGTNLQNVYDVTGNITSNSRDGSSVTTRDYTTPQTGCTYYSNPQPHAVRAAVGSSGTVSVCYDKNGNRISTSTGGATTSTFLWTSYNQPSSIAIGSNSSDFSYNAAHQRYKQVASYNGSPETTIYVGGLLEKVSNSTGISYRHYIPAGNNSIVYTRWNTGLNPTYYITLDHLGSTSVITDSTGTQIVSENFPASGNVYRGDNWTGANTTTEQNAIASVTRHGFTGQEMLTNLSLFNMNGRIGGGVGIFYSPDPYVPDPSNTQSFNRYTYAINNPLTRVDPTGYDDCDSCPSSPYGPQESNSTSGWADVGNDASDGTTTYGGANRSDPGWTGYSFAPDTLVNWHSGPGVGPGYWQDYHAESATTLNPDGTDSGPLDVNEMQEFRVDGIRSQWVSSAGCGVTLDCGFDVAAFGRALTPYNPGVAAAQFLALGVGGAGLGFGQPVYAGIGAIAGAAGGYRATHNLMGTLIGAGLGTFTGGTAAAYEAPVGLAGVAYSSLSGAASAGVATSSLNALTGQPVLQNVGYAVAIGALAPLATGEAMLIGGAGFATRSALGFTLNAASNTFAFGLGP